MNIASKLTALLAKIEKKRVWPTFMATNLITVILVHITIIYLIEFPCICRRMPPKAKQKTGKKNKNGKGSLQRKSYNIEQKLYAINMHNAGLKYKEIKRKWEKKYKMEIKSATITSWCNTKNMQKMSEYCGN